jgi:hypothetical protein
VPATGSGEACQDRGRSSATRISNEQTVLAIENDALHLALRDIMQTAGLLRIRQSGMMIYGQSAMIAGSWVGIITGSPGRRSEGLGGWGSRGLGGWGSGGLGGWGAESFRL